MCDLMDVPTQAVKINKTTLSSKTWKLQIIKAVNWSKAIDKEL